MSKKPHRINARMSAEEMERARELLSSHKIYGVHSLSDVVSYAVWQLYDSYFNKVLGELVVAPTTRAAPPADVPELPAKARKSLNSAAKKKAAARNLAKKGGGK